MSSRRAQTSHDVLMADSRPSRLCTVLHIGKLYIGTNLEPNPANKKPTRQDPRPIYDLPPELLIHVMNQTDIFDPERYDKLNKSFCQVYPNVCDDKFWRGVVEQLLNDPLIDDFDSNYKSFSLPEEKVQSWSDIVRQVYDAFNSFTEDQLKEVIGRPYHSIYTSTQWIQKRLDDFAGNARSTETENDAVVVMAKLLLSNISTDSGRIFRQPNSAPNLDKLVQAALEEGTWNIALIRVITRSALKGLVSLEQRQSTLFSSAEDDDTELMSYLFEAYDYTDIDLKKAFKKALDSGRENVFQLLAPRLSPEARIIMMREAKGAENEEAIDALRLAQPIS